MCGIVAGVAGRDVVPVFLQGLKRLEYRGYDSCGVAVVRNGEIDRARSVARVKDLAEQVQAEGMQGTVGIAHTRWATHGGPVVANAHPHIAGNRIALVHNGIIENFAQLRAELEATGARCLSSRTGFPRCATRTPSSCWSMAISSSAAPTTNCWPKRASITSCITGCLSWRKRPRADMESAPTL